MARVFSYEALTATGAVTHGRRTADSEAQLEDQLRAEGDFLIRAAAVDGEAEGGVEDAGALAGPGGEPPRRSRTDGAVSRAELLAFTEYLWSASAAGIPILTSLQDVETQLESRRMRAIVREVVTSMTEEGKTLSGALAQHPRAFSQLYVGTIEAGENTGQLDYVLGQLAEHLEWQREITLQIRQATLYPSLLLAVLLGLLVLLVTFVFPRLLPVFSGFDMELPLPTRVVFWTGIFLREQWIWLCGGLLGLVVALKAAKRTPRGKLLTDTAKLRLPIFGRLILQIEMSRVVTYLGLFYRTGIDLIRGLSLLEQIVENRRVSQAVGEARTAILGGDSIAHAFGATGLFPPVVIRSLALGESTGKLDESLERAQGYFAREVPAAVRRMLTALQPLLIVLLGVILGAIAMSIFLPMMRIYQAIGP